MNTLHSKLFLNVPHPSRFNIPKGFKKENSLLSRASYIHTSPNFRTYAHLSHTFNIGHRVTLMLVLEQKGLAINPEVVKSVKRNIIDWLKKNVKEYGKDIFVGFTILKNNWMYACCVGFINAIKNCEQNMSNCYDVLYLSDTCYTFVILF